MKANKDEYYSRKLAQKYVPDETEIILLSTKFKDVVKWINKEPTNQVIGYRILCGVPDDYFFVKFSKKGKLPTYGSRVKFKGLVACEYKNNIYFKADEIEEA